ncbi:Phosphoinositide phospholipase C 2 [Hibiscus syriacus]|uniref:Phosphoinositide phospholipase C n=1 Tax=Hibiscus syriacus TaxID=106335 RepID=A0A6A3D649_HIBSY|nr:Phosphoinositide phospholipase C 2 [Hibiscus syriacus]
MSKENYRVCLCWRRIFKTRVVEPPVDVKDVFYSISPSGMMTVDDLLRFLIQHQGQKNATMKDAQTIFDSLKHLSIFQRRGLHLDAFFRYLLGDLILAHPPPSKVHHDMNAPLSHYFLFTGHNSYLTGNQFSSKSSVEPIKDALLRGVRVIELDLWPSSKGNDVKETSSVGLQKCLQAIKENAFKASEYPVVITFEDHLKPNLQKKVAKWNPPEEGEHIPDEDEEKVVPEYRHIISIHAGKLKGGLENWLSDDPNKARRLSLSEQELQNAVKTHGTKTVKFTQRNLLRVYPKDARVDSSNYNPFVGWMHGAQMVAFNMQGHGKHLWIMQGMFKANCRCGYVKKPDFLLQRGPNDEVFDPSVPLDVKTIVKVKVIQGTFLGEGWHQDFPHTAFDCFSPPDFKTRIGIAGVPADKVVKETATMDDEWLPVWNQVFEFQLRVPELAVLRIKVLESDTGSSDFGGQACLPVSELRTGIRAVPLHEKKGNKYNHVRLLLSIKFEAPL